MIRTSYVLLAGILLFSCGDNNVNSEKPNTPRVKKSTRMESPNASQRFQRGFEIPLRFTANNDVAIDSIQLVVGDQTTTYTQSEFSISLPSRKVGTWQLRAKVFCGDASETHYRKIIVLPENAPEEMTYNVVNVYPHDTEDYTQGLLIKDGFLYESTGQRGKSTFKKKNLTTGETLNVVDLGSDLFGEGLTVYNDEFYQLTWTSGQGFVYDNEMNQTRTFSYQVEGWGLTTLGDELVLTDETEKIYFVEPSSFVTLREIEAYDNEGKVSAINELEIIDGMIWANVYLKDYIVVIDPETGEVVQKIDLTDILPNVDRQGVDVLNGIAQDPATGAIYVTGKWWPKLFKITIEPKTL